MIFDVDGTLADTERDGHRPAFNAAFTAHGLDIYWDSEEYGRLLEITGGRRRIAADLRSRGFGDAADQLAADVHRTKTALFRESILGGDVSPRPGLVDLVMSLFSERIQIAVATTGRRAWVEPLVKQLLGDGIVDVMVTGDDVTHLKPDPEVYTRALGELGVHAESALAVEDSAIGLQAALAAGLATVVVTTDYTAGQDFAGAAEVRRAFDDAEPLLAEHCRDIHRLFWAQQKLRSTTGPPQSLD
ncbi:HAD-IA family hydrolase [Mycobacterium intracellulare]|uniref:HAD-IA family hydrolase n=1 Tax=Mycobacterium intracellulare TaxID=1767 RepID=UPI000864E19E|nr:HAD-IA family hydrolase [Mycobacterium intracellulare]